ncbi:unnamed protein product [marine sediment metagenome]|uniref:Uncharacterized protein n=1 Tax=marine sediment metagenome TaxID=412755 RepID=X1IFK5_9ZZZZ
MYGVFVESVPLGGSEFDLTLIFLAAQRFAEAVEMLKTIKDHAEDIAKDLHE